MFDAVFMKEITPELANDIVRRYGKNQSLDHIRMATDVSIERIKQVLATQGVTLRPVGAHRASFKWRRPPRHKLTSSKP